MMNDETEQFEQRLSRLPLREIPHVWREEILREGRRVAVPNNKWDAGTASLPNRSWLATFNSQISTIFWPHPKAWAALAAIWIFIFAVNLSMRDTSPRETEKCAPPSPEMLVELRQQQLLLAELIGARDLPAADRPRNFAPKPSGARVEMVAV